MTLCPAFKFKPKNSILSKSKKLIKMTKGEGLVAFLYAIKGILEAGVIWVITGVAMIAFFAIIVRFIGNKFGWLTIGGNSWGSGGKKLDGNAIFYALFLLFVIFAIYSLIALTGSIFGVNSGPAGGLQIR